jgi:7,8-dihydropterin-6-yl-methyl-4-(beta-D-ribofuranosyl)aminobenzene 5'-phosphate synthase
MRIITLIENLVYKQGLFAEHGLSFYLETGHKKILFDTGQSGNFLTNAKALGIDISEIDSVIISHGHYDHTGGLYPFLKVNHKATVYIKKEAFKPKFHGTEKFIGIAYDPLLLDGRIEYVNGITEIDKDIFIMSDIPIKNLLDTNFHHFKISTPHGFENDEFNDELFLAIRRSNELSVISSCSHRGITNIIDAAISHFRLSVNLVIGGFHIRNCGADQLEAITMYLERFSAKSIGICHCTGVEKYAELVCHFKTRVFYNHTGYTIDVI